MSHKVFTFGEKKSEEKKNIQPVNLSLERENYNRFKIGIKTLKMSITETFDEFIKRFNEVVFGDGGEIVFKLPKEDAKKIQKKIKEVEAKKG